MRRKSRFRRYISIAMLVVGLMALLPAVVHAQGDDEQQIADLMLSINTVWVLIAGFLVLFMQAGFGFLEAGFVRSKNVVNIMAENFIDTAMTTVGFWAFGFGVMFGSGTSLFGTEWFFLSDLPDQIAGLPPMCSSSSNSRLPLPPRRMHRG